MVDETTHFLSMHAGHTRVKVGLYRALNGSEIPELIWSSAFANDDTVPWPALTEMLVEQKTHAVLTGSNPVRIEQLRSEWPATFNPPLLLQDKSLIPVVSRVDFPEKVGADRLLNAVAVNRLRLPHCPAIIVDSGTAITVDAVNSGGEFLGGAILPGVLMSARALNQFTTTLPLIDGREYIDHAPPALGRNTEAAMGSGLYWGHLGAVKELKARLSMEIDGEPQLFLTGGASVILAPYFEDAHIDPCLSLLGTVLTAIHLQ